MQIVIDIPQKWFDDMVREDFIEIDELCAIIQHSPILPKGHGRLIDADKLDLGSEWRNIRITEKSLWIANGILNDAPTVVEAEEQE